MFSLSDTIANATTADASELQAILTDIATALTGSVAADGQTTITGALEFSAAPTPATNDGAALGSAALQWSDLFLASGGVINWANGGTTITHGGSDNVAFQGATGGWGFENTIAPLTNDVAALGTATTNWADLFLASGAVINFNNGNYTLTHSAGALAASGTLSATTVSATTVTASGALSGATAAGAQIATQAEQEAGSATDKLVTPGRQHFHPGAAKAWAKFAGGTGTASASYNCTTSRSSAGTYTVTIGNDFSSANYAIVASVETSTATSVEINTQAAGSFNLLVHRSSDQAAVDPTSVYIVCYGDL